MAYTVEVRSLWIIRKSIDEGNHFPEMLLAWDEYNIEENYKGWSKACDDALAACGDDIVQWRIVSLAVLCEDIEAQFESGGIEAKVTGGK